MADEPIPDRRRILYPSSPGVDYAIVADPDLFPNGYSCSFAVYSVKGWSINADDSTGPPHFERKPTGMHDLAESELVRDGVCEPYLTGWIKWDGCSDWTFGEDSVHFCGREGAMELSRLFDRLYDIAPPLIPHWQYGKANS